MESTYTKERNSMLERWVVTGLTFSSSASSSVDCYSDTVCGHHTVLSQGLSSHCSFKFLSLAPVPHDEIVLG